MTVFVEDSDAAFSHHASQFLDQYGRIADKRHDPSAPREIVISSWQIIRHQIQLVDLDVRERVHTTRFAHRADEVL